MTAAAVRSRYGGILSEWDDGQPTWEITTKFHCAEYFSIRRQAMPAHRTQVDPDGPIFDCPLDLEQRVWPTEDYHLAVSRVQSTFPEDDLFAGVHT